MAEGSQGIASGDRGRFVGGGIPATTRSHVLLLSVLGTVALVAAGVLHSATAEDEPDVSQPVGGPEVPTRAFSDDSWWNTPLPDEAPLDPNAGEILDYLRTAPESGRGCLTLAGSGESPWGQPVYDATPQDPSYDIVGLTQPLKELKSLRIPVGAQSALNSDQSMTVYDRQKGYVVALTGAEYHRERDAWSAVGATVTYLDSNGLHVGTGRSDDPRNRGSHRGNNGATMAVEIDEVQAGAVRHVLKAASGPEVADRFVFPMVGSDGDYEGADPGVPPQGLRLRIKSSIDLETLGLHPQALVIARALQTYGFYIGDSGGTTAIKLQATSAEGRGQHWSVPAEALCGLPFTSRYWDVIAEGYDPTVQGAQP